MNAGGREQLDRFLLLRESIAGSIELILPKWKKKKKKKGVGWIEDCGGREEFLYHLGISSSSLFLPTHSVWVS